MPALDLELFLDYHCPYSYRAVEWLDRLDGDRLRIRHRLFGLEQVNRDPDAREWRLWEQPLDYQHDRERQDRRALAAFLATAVVDAHEAPDVRRAFRLGVYRARFEDGYDITSTEVLERIAAAAGARPGRVGEMLASDAGVEPDAARGGAELSAARRRIADDWARAREEFLVFGVPTIRIATEAPFYLRLAERVPADAAEARFGALLAFREAMPGLLEIKAPERADAAG